MNSLIISVLVRSVLLAKASKMRSSCSGILIFNCLRDMLRVRVGMLYCVCGFIVGCIRLTLQSGYGLLVMKLTKVESGSSIVDPKYW
jgi:hypothetical protein